MCERQSRVASGIAASLVLAAGLVGSASMQAWEAQPARPAWADQVDRVFAEWDRTDSPGCAVAVIKDGAIAYERGYGMADLEHDIPIAPETVFYIGSVSKQFTAMAAALAVQDGRVGLDDDIRRFLPELPDYGRPVTVRHLVHHTSGLRDIYALLTAAGRRDVEAFDNEAVLRIVARQKALNFPPGEEHLYSNSGYTALALVVERATGTPFAEYTEAHIFEPLGMMVSHFHTDLSRLVRDRAYGYQRGADGRIRLNTPESERAGAGGMFASVRDLAKWDQNFYDGRVGGLDLIRQFETPGKLNNGTALTYAWGLTVGAYRGLPFVEHGGSLGGYRAHIIRFRDERFSVVALCNLASIAPGTLARRVADITLGDRLKPAPAASQAAPARPSRAAGERYEPAKLAEFAGRYVSDELESVYEITVDKDHLRLRRGHQRQVLSLQPGPRDEFSVAGGTIRFVRNAAGRVEGLTVNAGRARGMRFEKHQGS